MHENEGNPAQPAQKPGNRKTAATQDAIGETG